MSIGTNPPLLAALLVQNYYLFLKKKISNHKSVLHYCHSCQVCDISPLLDLSSELHIPNTTDFSGSNPTLSINMAHVPSVDDGKNFAKQ